MASPQAQEDTMSRFGKLARAAGCAALTAAGSAPALAQTPAALPGSVSTVPAAPAYGVTVAPPTAASAPTTDLFRAGVHHKRPVPGYYYPPAADCPPPGAALPGGTPPGTAVPEATLPPAPAAPDLFAGADAGPTNGLGGYIDNALPITTFRLRYDANYGNNRPDRGEFFYAKCGCFGTADARGPRLPERNVDYQELQAYLEYAITRRFSVFTNVPVRFINPEANRNAEGISDLQFGGKYALVYGPTRVLTAQLKVIVPTGREEAGLGTGNTWLEPALLYQEQLSARWQLFGQVKDQFSLDRQSDFTGNVLTYGLGTSYVVASGCWGYVAPVGEVVGWTLLSGRELNPDTGMDQSARGDTIVNGKFGVRVGFGKAELGQPYPTRSDLYVGYGRALTGEVWYQDMLRVEYRMFF